MYTSIGDSIIFEMLFDSDLDDLTIHEISKHSKLYFSNYEDILLYLSDNIGKKILILIQR